jgi:excisionase family DNA binding protein
VAGEDREVVEMTQVLTAADVARHCHVSFSTVRRWIREDYLPAYMTPSGHYRILPSEFRAFLGCQGMPMDETFFAELEPEKRILIVSDERRTHELIARALRNYDDRFETAAASDPRQALKLVGLFHPHLVALDLSIPHAEGFQVSEWIWAHGGAHHIKILALAVLAESDTIERAVPLAVDDVVRRPLDIGQLLTKVDRLLSTD